MNKCKWTQSDYNSDLFDTACGEMFVLTEGGPEGNGMICRGLAATHS